MKYRKKPVVVEAVQFTRDNLEQIVNFTKGKAADMVAPKHKEGKYRCSVNTLEGIMQATEGDYIIKGVKGEFYPCKPEIFDMTYEVVDGE